MKIPVELSGPLEGERLALLRALARLPPPGPWPGWSALRGRFEYRSEAQTGEAFAAPAKIWERRWGDCDDAAVLVASWLGPDATPWPVLYRGRPHVIVRVGQPPRSRYLDPSRWIYRHRGRPELQVDPMRYPYSPWLGPLP